MFDEIRWGLLQRVVQDLPPGPSVVCGVGEGGPLAYIALRRPEEANFGFCRFEEGLTEPGPYDDEHVRFGMCPSRPFSEILGWFSHNDIPAALIPGDVRKTFFVPEGCALALLDLNLYEPTLFCLKELDGKMAKGGVILVDDFYYPGVCKALQDSPFSFQQDSHMGVYRVV